MKKKMIVLAVAVMLLCMACGRETPEKRKEKKATVEKKYGETVQKSYRFLEFDLPKKALCDDDSSSGEDQVAWLFKEKNTWYLFAVSITEYDEKTYKNNLVDLGEVQELPLPGARRFKMGEQVVLKGQDCTYTEGCFLYKDKSVKLQLLSPYTEKPEVPTEEILEDIVQTIEFIEE